MSGASKEVKEFQFKLNRKLRVFPENQGLQLENPVKLVASASKYGLIFAGCPTGILCISSSSVLTNDPKKSQGFASFEYARREVNFGSQPTHLDVNADNELLAVVVIIQDVPVLQVYSVQSFASANIVKKSEMRLGNSSGVKVSDLQWNPGVPNMIGAVLNDGSAVVFECKDASFEVNSIPPMAQATCLCWSPKGKQVVLGARNGSLTQYKPELKAVKTFPPPSADMFVVSVHWLSNFQFLAAYGNIASPTDRPTVMIVNVPKNQPPSFVTYDEVCFGFLAKRPEYFFIHQQAWNIVILGSGDSMEVSVLGSEPDGVTWNYWKQDDATRAELPLTEVGSQDVHNVGIAIDYSPTNPVPVNDSLTVGPMPLLVSLSHSGVMCIFRILNLFPGATPICAPPQPLADQSGVHLFTQPQSPVQQAQPAQAQIQPEVAPQPVQPAQPVQQPVQQPTQPVQAQIPQPVQVEATKPLVSVPSLQPAQSGPVPASQPQFNFFQSKPAGAPTSVPEASAMPSYQAFQSAFSQPAPAAPVKPALLPTPSSAAPTSTATVVDSPSANIAAAPAVAGTFSLGMSMNSAPAPPPAPAIEQKVPAQIPEAKPPPQAPVVAPPPPVPAEPKEPEVVKVDDSVYKAAIHEELLAFQAKMTGVSKYVKNIETKVADEAVKGELLHQRDQYQEFVKELVEATGAQSTEVNQLRSNLLDLITFFETIKTRHCILNNPRLREMREAGELDPISKLRLKNIDQQLYYIQSQLKQAAAFVDNSKKKQNGQTGIPIPTMEKVHQTIKTITKLVNAYKYKLTDIESKLNDHVKKMHQRKKTFPQIEPTKKTPAEDSQLSTLAQKLLQTKLSDDSGGSVEVGTWRLISLSKKGSQKAAEWASWVRRHKVLETRVTQLGSTLSPLQATLASSPQASPQVINLPVETPPKTGQHVRSISRNLFDTSKSDISILSTPLIAPSNLITSTPLPAKEKAAFVPPATSAAPPPLKPFSTLSTLPEQPKMPVFSVPTSTEPKPLIKTNMFSGGTVNIPSSTSALSFTAPANLGIQPPKPSFQGFGSLGVEPGKTAAADAKETISEPKISFDLKISPKKAVVKPPVTTVAQVFSFSTGNAVTATTSSGSSAGFGFTGLQMPKTTPAVPVASVVELSAAKAVSDSTAPLGKPSSEPTFSFGGLSLGATPAPVTTSSVVPATTTSSVSSFSFGGLSTSTNLFSQSPSTAVSPVSVPSTTSAVPAFGSGSLFGQSTSAGSIFGSAAMKFTSSSGIPAFGSSSAPTTNLFAPAAVATTSSVTTKAVTVTTAAASAFSFANTSNSLSLFGQTAASTAPVSQSDPSTGQSQPTAVAVTQSPAPPVTTSAAPAAVSVQSAVPFSLATVSSSTTTTSAPSAQPQPVVSGTSPLFGGATSASAVPLFGSQVVAPPTSAPLGGTSLALGHSIFGQQSATATTTAATTTAASVPPLLPTPAAQTVPTEQATITPVSTQPVSPPESSAPATSTSATPLFGQPVATTSTAVSTPLFGQAAAVTSAPNIFGQAAAAATTSAAPAPIFGQSAVATAPSASLFPSASPSPASPFGHPPATTSSMFGQPAQAAAPAFGTSAAAPSFGGTPTFGSGSVFGTPTQTTSVFGTPPAQTTSVFGTPFSFTSPTTTQSVFGSPSATTSSGIFGTPTSTPSVFGSPSTNISTSTFGQAPATPFGQTGQASPFGSPPSSQANPFFNPPPSASAFGQQPSAGNFGSSGGSMFGSSFSPQQGGAIFGGGASFGGVGQSGFGSSFQQSKQSGFGGAPVFGSSPAFGGSPAFGSSPGFGSPGNVFGSPGASAGGGFGSSPGGNVFESMANQNTMTFGNLAQNQQQQQQPSVFGGAQQNKSPSFGGNSFTAWPVYTSQAMFSNFHKQHACCTLGTNG